MKGFFGKVLEIDLDQMTHRSMEIPEDVQRTYLGGRGLAAYLLSNLYPAGIDPLDPESVLVFALGPAADTKVWGSSRYGVFCRSPLTGLFGESYSGGRVAEHMSRSGYDAFVITGRAEKPTALEIGNDGVTFRDATHLWGMDTYATQDALEQAAERKCGVLVIGPAGENRVSFAVIENNYWRSAGRTGMGAVMGSKNLKGLIFHGDADRPVADKGLLSEFWTEWKEKNRDHPVANAFRNNGTPMLVAVTNKLSAFPTRYWQKGVLEGWEAIGAETLHNDLKVSPRACAKCFMACGRMAEVISGRHKGLKIEGPEYETIYAFGGLCEIRSIEEIAWLNDICDRLGLDTISAGNLCALAIETSRIGKADLGLDYGDADGVARLLRQIARREGAGAILANGAVSAAREWGVEDMVIHIKGMEPAGYDPRIFKTMALSYATSPRGGCHLRTTAFRAELVGDIPMDQVEGKATVVIDYEDRATLHDSLITCRFYRDLYAWEGLGTIIAGLTGIRLDKSGLTRLATNIRNQVQRFNIAHGWSKDMDTLPARFFNEPVGDGRVVRKEDLDYMVADYYRLRCWDEKGSPPEGDEVVL